MPRVKAKTNIGSNDLKPDGLPEGSELDVNPIDATRLVANGWAEVVASPDEPFEVVAKLVEEANHTVSQPEPLKEQPRPQPERQSPKRATK